MSTSCPASEFKDNRHAWREIAGPKYLNPDSLRLQCCSECKAVEVQQYAYKNSLVGYEWTTIASGQKK